MSADLRCLHLEDDPLDAELVQAQLRLGGVAAQIQVVRTRADYLASIEPGGPDLILADYFLPGFNGLAALDLARDHAPDVPFIFVTGQLGEERAVEALRHGATDYVFKTQLGRLAPAVKRALAERDERRRRQAAESAAQSEHEWLRAALASIGDAVIATDTTGRVTFMNASAQAITGWAEAEARGRPAHEVFKIVNETTREAVESPVDRGRRAGLAADLAGHTVLIRKDGADVPIDDSHAPIRDARGQLLGDVLVFRDISDRRRSQAALQEREALYRSLVELSPDAIFIHRHGTIQYINPAGAQLLGAQQAEDLVGRSWLDEVVLPDRRSTAQERLQQLAAGQTVPFIETRWRRFDGGLVEVEVGAAPVMYQGQPAVQVVARAITERKRAESALRESEARFRTLANVAPTMVWTAAPDGTITFANDRWFEYAGITPEQNARGWPELVLHPDDHDRCLALWNRALRDGTDYEVEARNRRHDGEYRWFLTRAVPIRAGDGRISAWYGTSTDIHDRKLAEAELRKSEESMRLATAANRMVAWEWDPAADRITASENFAEIYGLPALSGVAEGFALVWPEDKAARHANVARVAADGGEYRSIFRITRPADGQMVWLEERARALTDAGGRVTRLVGVVTDITDRQRTEAQLEAQRRRWQALAEVSRTLAAAGLDLQNLLDQIVQQMARVIGDACTLRLPQPDGATHTLAAVAHHNPEALAFYREFNATPLRADEGMSGRVFQSGQAIFLPVVTPDQMRAASPPRFWPYLDRFPIHSGMAVPLQVQGRTIGVLSLSRDITPAAYTEDDMRLAAELAERAALAIEKARLYQSEQQARQAAERGEARTAALQAVTAALANAVTPLQVAQVVVGRGVPALGAARGTVMLLVDDGQNLAILDTDASDELVRPYRHFPVSRRVPGADAVRDGQTVWLETRQQYLDQYPDLAEQIAAWGYQAAAAIPLTASGPALGVLTLSFDQPVAIESENGAYAHLLARLCGQALERARLYEETQRLNAVLEERVRARTAELAQTNERLVAEIAERQLIQTRLEDAYEQVRSLTARLQDAREQERTRVAHEVHDELAQQLSALKMDVGWLKGKVGSDQPQLAHKLQEMGELLDHAVWTARSITSELRPGVLDDFGLVAAVEWQLQHFEAQHQIRTRFTTHGEPLNLPPEVVTAVYRMLQEALSNVSQHAGASQVDVTLEVQADYLALQLRDNGRGISTGALNGRQSLGLLGLRERARRLGGQVSIEGSRGQGTSVLIKVPLGKDGDRRG